MIYLVLILFIFSTSVNVYFFRLHRNKQKEMIYMRDKLRSIIDIETRERILLQTDDKYIQSLLVQINRLIDENQETIANYKNIEHSMRKMLSNISHDLKTPLTVILGYTEMIHYNKNLAEDKREQFLQTIHLKTEEVLELINRFFDLVKLESGDKKISCSRIELCELSRKIILEYNEILIHKAFDVSIDIPDEAVYVWGSEEALESVLHNLISNAIQYGADGKMIRFQIRVTENTVYVEVTDKGKGISELHRDRVFERMYTLEDSRNNQYQGSGLGLTITKRFIEQMEGTISLDSVPFENTTFTVGLKRIRF
ncbi:sensor histidine kinase [Oceanobacillus jeddahense]|uniref:histidine kinase n=1 Tax=Oceanobacillus jeddahense TaxID=1462527 RepID=A0ABY5K0Y4_9BACI|nr:sensor histidine kinase [Oceanobacillus jeddahense]UUI04777.1 sensor histidine kinase [Oceanobacillus jeddahense]